MSQTQKHPRSRDALIKLHEVWLPRRSDHEFNEQHRADQGSVLRWFDSRAGKLQNDERLLQLLQAKEAALPPEWHVSS